MPLVQPFTATLSRALSQRVQPNSLCQGFWCLVSRQPQALARGAFTMAATAASTQEPEPPKVPALRTACATCSSTCSMRPIEAISLKVKLALCQMAVSADKATNLAAASRTVKVSRIPHEALKSAAPVSTCLVPQEAAGKGAKLVVLPEMFNCPYSNESFPKYAEDIDGGSSDTARQLSGFAAGNGVTLVAGSIPETSGDKLYNTCLVFDRHGKQLAKHRKVPLGVHLHSLLVSSAMQAHSYLPSQLHTGSVPSQFSHTPFMGADLWARMVDRLQCCLPDTMSDPPGLRELPALPRMPLPCSPSQPQALGTFKFLTRQLRAETAARCPRTGELRQPYVNSVGKGIQLCPRLPPPPSGS